MSTVISNSMATTGAGGALAVTVSTRDGNGIIAGDLIVANCMSDGTHVANALAVQDSVNAVAFTNLKEQVLGGASALWQQVLYYVAAANVPDGSTVTLTPFAAATHTALAVTVVRFSLGTVSNAVVSQGNVAGISQPAPALGAAPVRGQFVMTFDAAASGALTPAGTFTADSAVTGAGGSAANAYATADGVSTWGSTWTDAASAVSATMTVAFNAAGVGVAYKIAQANAASGASTLVATVATPSIANDALYVIIGMPAGTNAPTGVADTQTHTYTQRGSVVAPSGMTVYFYESLHAVTPLAGGNTVTATFTNSTLGKVMFVVGCAGMNQTADVDPASTSAYGSGIAPSATAPQNLANNNELAIAAVTAGGAAGDVVWPAGWTELGQLQAAAGGIFTSVAVQVETAADPVTASATLTGSAVWAELLMLLTPDPPTGAAATLTITTGSPLPAGTVGTQYGTQIAVTGGVQPYAFNISAGALPTGLTISPGGGTKPVATVGVNTAGAIGAANTVGLTPTLATWQAAQNYFGGSGGHGGMRITKLFFSGSAPLPATWAATSGTAGPAADICANDPGTVVILCWNANMTASAIANFCKSVPAGQVVYFSYISEMEADPIGATNFVNNFKVMADAVHGVGNPNLMTMPTSAGYLYTSTFGAQFLPGPQWCDSYGIDTYQREKNIWPAGGLAGLATFQRWLTLVKPFNKPLCLAEYGLANSLFNTDMRNARLQQDWAYLQASCGPSGNGAVSPYPLVGLMYWWRNMGNPPATDLQFVDAPAVATFKSMIAAAGTGGGQGGGGFISGTPTTAQTTTPSVHVLDSAPTPNTVTKAFSVTINAPVTNPVFDTTSPLPGATASSLYSLQFAAHGGTAPLSFALHAGSVLPTGLSLSAGGLLSGTPTVTGTATFSVDCNDSAAHTTTAAFSLTVAGQLTITTTSLPAGQSGTVYGPVTLATANGTPPYTWSLVAGSPGLPAGLTLDSALGVIAGTPTTPGSTAVQFQVMDSAPATATATLTLTVASLGGGLPPLGRRRFGGTTADWAFTFAGDAIDRAAGVTVTFYTALTGGTQITDLTTTGSAPITSVVTDASGEMPEFFGPDSVMEMYADANGGLGPRRRIVAADLADAMVLLWPAVQRLGG